MIAAGLLWMSRVSADGAYATDILGPIVVAAFGLGLSFPPGTYAATAGVAPRDAGLASGLVNSTRQIGGAVGPRDRSRRSPCTRRRAPSPAATRATEALVAGYGRAFLVGAGIAVAASLSALIIPGAPRERAEAAPSPRHPRADMSMWMNDHWCPSRSRNPRMYMNP